MAAGLTRTREEIVIARDSFDRLLAAQALEERVAIVSADAIFRKYGVKRIW